MGEVTKEELLEKVNPNDSTAGATILFQKGETRFDYSSQRGFEMITEVETKIKIYKKEGLDFANFEIETYKYGGNKELVNFSKCITYNLESGKIEKSKLKSDGEFKEELSRYYDNYKIVMPNVKEGSIIEYKYTITSPFINRIPRWNFQSTVPVNYSEYVTKIPEYYVFNVHNKGYLTPTVSSEIKNKEFSEMYQERYGTGGAGRPLNHERGTYSLKYTEKVTKYIVNNAKPIKDEDFVGNVDNYISSVDYELVSTRYPNQPFKNYATNWNDVVKDIYENEDFGGQLKGNDFLKSTLDEILGGSISQDEKISKIYGYIYNNISWNGYNGYFADKGIKKALKEKSGNVADINLLLVAMLREASVEANPMILSTRSNGIALFPSRKAFNYVVCAIETNNGLILIDASDKKSSPNMLPIKCLNWDGRIVRKDGTSISISLRPNSSSTLNRTLMATIDENGTINGKIREQYFDYYNYIYLNDNKNKKDEEIITDKEKSCNDAEIENYSKKEDNKTNSITESYSFTSQNTIDIISGKMYLKPLLFFGTKENPFKEETREYPIDFTFAKQNKFNISFSIPEGYEVETLPEAANVVIENGVGNFSYVIRQNGNQIQLISSIEISKTLLGAEYYSVIKDFFNKIVEKHNEKIVLKRKI
ncbi:MAG: DUF3857 domain-containing protein [Flavobacterium sp.]|nr:DUF3857 domain-containing protein [Flavobacterium sp.]